MLAPFALLIATQDRTPSVTGRLEILANFHSEALGYDRGIRVSLPEDYDRNPTRRYPVFYMHDGQNLFDGATSFIPNEEWGADETAQRLAKEGKARAMIIVGIDNAGVRRADEYVPTRRRLGKGFAGGRLSLYERFLLHELMPAINEKFRTLEGPKNTALGGSWLGGVATQAIGLAHPEVFGMLAIASPSIWWDGQWMVRQVRALPSATGQKVWIDMGTREGASGISNLRILRDAYVQKGWKLGQDLACVEAEGAGHNEAAWRARFPAMLEFLFPPQAHT